MVRVALVHFFRGGTVDGRATVALRGVTFEAAGSEHHLRLVGAAADLDGIPPGPRERGDG